MLLQVVELANFHVVVEEAQPRDMLGKSFVGFHIEYRCAVSQVLAMFAVDYPHGLCILCRRVWGHVLYGCGQPAVVQG